MDNTDELGEIPLPDNLKTYRSGYLLPGQPIPDGRKRKAKGGQRRKKKRKSWAEFHPVRSINVPPTVCGALRETWIRNAVIDLARRISIQKSKPTRRVTRRELGKLVAGTTSQELWFALDTLAGEDAIRGEGLTDFLASEPLDRKTNWYPQMIVLKKGSREVHKTFYRGELVTAYWLANQDANVHNLPYQDIAKRIFDNNWSAEDALRIPGKNDLEDPLFTPK